MDATALIAGRGACVVLVLVGFGFRVGLATTLRGVFFTRVGVGVGVTTATGAAVTVLVGVGVGDSTAAAVLVGDGAAGWVADEQPAVSATATAAATHR